MGILDGKALGLDEDERIAAENEADTLFGCVFIGLLADGLRNDFPMGWDVEPEADSKKVERGLSKLKDTLKPLADYVARKLGLDVPDVRFDESPTHWYAVVRNQVLQKGSEDAKFVGIRADPEPSSDLATRQARVPSEALTDYILKNFIGELSVGDDAPGYEGLLRSKTDTEFGAYYGIVDHEDNFPPKVISSVRRLIPYSGEHGRWNRGVPFHGLIGYDQNWPEDRAEREKRKERMIGSEKQAGSIEPQRLIRRWAEEGGADCVCGYCHGMIWAVAQEKCQFPGGVPYELGLGKNTLKLSSCFGCTTFLYANDYAPSSMHLGRAESWVPLPEDEDSAGVFLDSVHVEDLMKIVAMFKKLNQQWADKVCGWMTEGAELIVADDLFADWARAHATVLLKTLRGGGGHPGPSSRQAANWFLDALTVHKKDIDRLEHILAGTG